MISWRRRCLLRSQIHKFLSFHSQPPPNSFSPDPKSRSISISEAPVRGDSVDRKTVLETLSSYTNDWNCAFEFFAWLEADCGFRHSTDTYNQMIDILGKFFEFDRAWNLIDRMRTDPHSLPNHATFRVLFKRYASAHLVEEAISTFHRTEEFNLKDQSSFSNLIDALCEYKHVVEAEEICLSKDVRVNLDTKIYNIMLRGWFKMGWWSKCREFWEEMDSRGVRKDLHSYAIYMDIECKRGKPWKAVKLYKEMKKKGIRLDVVAYNTVLHAAGRSEGVDFAIRLYRQMKETGRCEPNVVTHNTIIKLLGENGRVREAYKVFDEMHAKGCEPNIITYHSIFRYLEKPREILNLFDRMLGSGIVPTMDTYVMLMRRFGRWGFLRPVLDVWKKMEGHGLSPNDHAYNALIDALVQKGMVDMARKYDQEMLAKGLSAKPRIELERGLLSSSLSDNG
ncbi:pentatricopeptide repeat-containing protein At1g80550, mitochondrial [Diospyros lotus]|uniref:pentatricopeptide repeat-containing protein At1g80550, mitochondrial n=1 Tax=Diospyros lotus TaxID=55363 RepID=UPI002254EA91|nr:pentatricopeptide repeat-containing protein At1g80550, mitochondrial [Diospyros lotus]